MSFKISLSPQPRKYLRKHKEKVRILDKIESSLTSDPFKGDIEVFKGRRHHFRLRIGNYRVVFHVNYSNKTIDVLRIGKRKNVY